MEIIKQILVMPHIPIILAIVIVFIGVCIFNRKKKNEKHNTNNS